MLKIFKNINKFGLVAILLAGTTAFAFKAPAPKRDSVVWHRTATSLTKETSNTWVQSAPSGSCLSASRICSASFESGYDPNDNSYDDNVANAEGTITDGYRTN